MKKTLYAIVCIIAIFTVSSCGYFNEKGATKDPQDNATTIEGISQEIKNKIAAQDTLMNALVLKVDTLAQALTLAQTENAELKAQVEKLESPRSTWAWMTIGAIALSIIAILMALLKKGLNKKEVLRIVEDSLNHSQRLSELISDVKNLRTDNNRSTRNSLSNSSVNTSIENRLSQVEKILNEVVNYINGQAQNNQRQSQTGSQVEQQSKQPERHRIGYAKIDTDMYFTTIYDSNQEGCVFKITFTSQTKGKFNLIALDKIQSRNDWQKKVECSGISIKEASDFRLEDEGICEKIDENTWEVTKPLKIRLLK